MLVESSLGLAVLHQGGVPAVVCFPFQKTRGIVETSKFSGV